MAYHHQSIIGLPRSGKTTFLAALWHLIESGEVSTKIVLDKLVGDHSHLNTIVEAWRRCEEVPRTSRKSETHVAIHARAVDGDRPLQLNFPDLSGESFEQLFASRACERAFVESFAKPGGILLFINANRATDGIPLADLGQIEHVVPAGGSDKDREWIPDMVPEQVRLVDILQLLQRPPFERMCRLAVIISAWDVLPNPKPKPAEWLAREMPLLHQFLRTNTDTFSSRVYGVSAQGGDVAGAGRMTLAQCNPSERICCVGPDADGHDLTQPILWLAGDGGDGE